jgi:microcystin-dependent protein
MEGTIGEIRLFAGTFAPMYWNYCDGSLQSIANYNAAYAILGTTFGGDGVNTFAMPDLKGRIAVGTGQGPNLPLINLGDKAGAYQLNLTSNTMPTHTHAATATTVTQKAGTGKVSLVSDPTNNFMGQTPAATPIFTATPTANVFMGSNSVNVQIGSSGNGLPFSLMQPYLGMNFIVCLEGIFPSRN